MFLKTDKPLPNRKIRVFTWCREVTEDGVDYFRDFDEINSNEYNSASFDGWEYSEDVK